MQPIAAEIARKAGVLVIGYAGGGTRHVIASRPVTSMADLAGLPIRVRGAPIQARLFAAIAGAT